MLPAKAFEPTIGTAQRLLAKAKGALDGGRGNLGYALQLGFEEQLKLAEIALLADSADSDVKAAFEEATRWGVRWALNEVPSAQLAITHIEASLSGDGKLTGVTRQQSPTTPALQPIAFDKFFSVLNCAVAFGTPEQQQRVASIPEQRYRSPGLIVPESEYQALAGVAAIVRGDMASAKKLLLRAIDTEPHRPSRSLYRARVALINGDWIEFETALDEYLRGYGEFYTSHPDHIEGVINLHGMALCRLAIRSGHQPPIRPYLPLQLLAS